MSESCGPSAVNESIASNKTRTALAQPEARVPAAPRIVLLDGQSPVLPPPKQRSALLQGKRVEDAEDVVAACDEPRRAALDGLDAAPVDTQPLGMVLAQAPADAPLAGTGGESAAGTTAPSAAGTT